MTSVNSSVRPRQGFNTSVRSIHWIGLTLLLLSLLAALPLWNGPGIVNTRGGGDSPFLFFRLQQLMANLREGVFPVRWMPDAAYGLGYPFFNFYASLPYYLAAIFNFTGIDLLTSVKIVQTLGFVGAGFALYGWARRHFTTRLASWLAAVAYMYAPFHFVNVYVRGDSLSEFYAFIFFPLILWSIDRIFESVRHWPLLALSYGGLILTHNVSALIFSPFIVLYALIHLLKSKVENQKIKIAAVTLGLALAFALAAFFWLPALGEAALTQVSDVQTTGYFNYSEHFRSTNLLQNSIGFDYSITTAPGSNSPFAMGLAQAIGTIVGLIALIVTWKKAAQRRFRLFVLIGLMLSTLMITPLSKPLWDTLPLLSYSQFPWRFLSIQALFTSLTIGYLAYCCLPLTIRKLSLAPIAGSVLVASMLFTLHPDYLSVRADEITPARLQLYEAFTGNIGTTIRAEYLPRTMIPRPYTGPGLIDPTAVPLRPLVSQGEATGAQMERHAIAQHWQVNVTSDEATLSFPITYWPGWQALVDDQPIETQAAPDLGYIQIDVPRGEHRVEFKLGDTPIGAASETLSAMALIGVVLACVPLRRTIDWQQLRWSFNTWTGALVITTLVGCGLFVWMISLREGAHTITKLETMDFVDKPWLHLNPSGYVFDQRATLLDYSFNAPQSDGIDAALEWKLNTAEEVSVTLALASPATHLLPSGPGPITQTVALIRNGLNTYTLRSPYALPAGMYYVTVQVGDDTQFLRPIWIKNSGEPAASPQFGSLTSAIGLAAAQTQLHDPNHLDVLLRWTISGVTAANYGISLRLHDAAGKMWTSLDTQPGYGFQPTSSWQPGTLNDAYTLELPPDLPRDQAYALDVILYRVASKEEMGRTSLDALRLDPHDWRSVEPPARNFIAPEMPHPLDAVFGDQIQLLGYELKREGDTLKIDLAWKALRDITGNYKVFVHVFDPTTETIVAQRDAMPRDNAYPTSRWIANEIVTETISIPLTAVSPGGYRLAVGLYEPAGPLPSSGTDGVDAGNRRVILEEKIVR
ncbi:hypothetical protein TFLX_05488 [Thermoflexales bacterium]|nr:hypothetical protein TFLX_05488 [Thermoflexales bacterium]